MVIKQPTYLENIIFSERILEDHDSLVENMVMWTRDTKNKILFESRHLKNDLFKCPEVRLSDCDLIKGLSHTHELKPRHATSWYEL